MKKYKHIFFDFDNTLWDFTHNSKESLNDVFIKYELSNYFSDFNDFFEKYEKTNLKLWEDYRKGKISKETLSIRRFSIILDEVKYPDFTLAQKLNSDYLTLTTTKTKIIDYAFNVLNYLKNKYLIHIITDGFFEVQIVKLKTSKLSPFISNVITAEEVGFLKPSIELFEEALESVKAKKEESIMIGDSYESDILGAHNAGIDQIFLNPDNRTDLKIKPTYTISNLNEIMDIL
jgi:putative hydrolase of the HAD superfamily